MSSARRAGYMKLGNGGEGADDDDADRLFDKVSDYIKRKWSITTVSHDRSTRLQNFIVVHVTGAAIAGDKFVEFQADFPESNISYVGNRTEIRVPLKCLDAQFVRRAARTAAYGSAGRSTGGRLSPVEFIYHLCSLVFTVFCAYTLVQHLLLT
jgi:hypothetical protein